jgi:hypothetical protein
VRSRTACHNAWRALVWGTRTHEHGHSVPRPVESGRSRDAPPEVSCVGEDLAVLGRRDSEGEERLEGLAEDHQGHPSAVGAEKEEIE